MSNFSPTLMTASIKDKIKLAVEKKMADIGNIGRYPSGTSASGVLLECSYCVLFGNLPFCVVFSVRPLLEHSKSTLSSTDPSVL